MTRQPTLFLLCGRPGAGKTTLAKELERERPALRLTPDDWLVALFGVHREKADAHRDAIEALQWEVAARALDLGCDVVLDWAFWKRAERDEMRARAAKHDARVELRYLAGRVGPPSVFPCTEEEMAEWERVFEPPSPDELA